MVVIFHLPLYLTLFSHLCQVHFAYQTANTSDAKENASANTAEAPRAQLSIPLSGLLPPALPIVGEQPHCLALRHLGQACLVSPNVLKKLGSSAGQLHEPRCCSSIEAKIVKYVDP